MLPPLWTQQTVPPAAGEWWAWDVTSLGQLSRIRRDLRRLVAAGEWLPDAASPAAEHLLSAFDELTSNALRHGSPPVCARILTGDDCWLVDVSDAAVQQPPVQAIDRDPAQGGMGLYLVAALAVAHGWWTDGSRKHVWAAVPFDGREPSQPVLPHQRTPHQQPGRPTTDSFGATAGCHQAVAGVESGDR